MKTTTILKTLTLAAAATFSLGALVPDARAESATVSVGLPAASGQGITFHLDVEIPQSSINGNYGVLYIWDDNLELVTGPIAQFSNYFADWGDVTIDNMSDTSYSGLMFPPFSTFAVGGMGGGVGLIFNFDRSTTVYFSADFTLEFPSANFVGSLVHSPTVNVAWETSGNPAAPDDFVIYGFAPGVNEGITTIGVIPEPSTYALLGGVGAVALAVLSRRRRRG